MDYPEEGEELTLAEKMISGETPEKSLESNEVAAVFTVDKLPELRGALNSVVVKPELIEYMVKVVRVTRKHPTVLVGAGPRATQAFLLATRVNAVIAGRDFVTPDDIKELSVPILGHRIILKPEFEIEGLSVPEVVEQILKEVAIPR
jgi:MoxR-like ATPase